MSNDHDELASAYLDGQATTGEVERVHGDPDLRARVEEMRAVAGRLSGERPTPDPAARRRHLRVALDAFDDLADSGDTGPATDDGSAVVELTQQREQRYRSASAGGGSRRPGRLDGRANGPAPGRWASSYRWLSAAAVLVVVVGGLGFLATLERQNDDEIQETESAATGEAEAPAESTLAAGADSAGRNDLADEEEASGQATAEDESADTPAAAEEETEEAADGDAGTVATDDASEAAATTAPASGGLFPDEVIEQARQPFGEVPSDAEQADLVTGELVGPELSTCGPVVSGPQEAELIGFVPVAVNGVNGELLAYRASGGGIVPVLVDSQCQHYR
jgi:hypothetical protein